MGLGSLSIRNDVAYLYARRGDDVRGIAVGSRTLAHTVSAFKALANRSTRRLEPAMVIDMLIEARADGQGHVTELFPRHEAADDGWVVVNGHYVVSHEHDALTAGHDQLGALRDTDFDPGYPEAADAPDAWLHDEIEADWWFDHEAEVVTVDDEPDAACEGWGEAFDPADVQWGFTVRTGCIGASHTFGRASRDEED